MHTHGLHAHQPPVSLHGAPAAPPPHRTTDTAFVPCMGIHLPPDLSTHPPKEIHLHRAMQTPAPAIHAHAYRNHLSGRVCSQHACTRMDSMCTHKQKCLCVDRSPYTQLCAHNSGPPNTPTPSHKRYPQLHQQILTEPLPLTCQLGAVELQ